MTRARQAVVSQPLKFLLAGGLAALVNWVARLLLAPVMPFDAAVAVGYAIGMSAGFALYRSWVFPGSPLPIRTQALRFLAVNALGAAVVLGVALGLVGVLESLALSRAIAEALAHATAIGVGAVFNFAGHKMLSFAVQAPAARP